MKVNRKIFLPIITTIALVAMIGCPTDDDSSSGGNGGNGGGSSNDKVYVVYGDAWHSDIDTNELYFNESTAPHVFATSNEIGGAVDATGKVLKLDFSGLTTGGWNGINAKLSNAAKVDLSSYTTLSFYAKVDNVATKVKEFIVVNDNKESIKLTDTSFTTEWKQYVIPIFDGSFLSNTGIVFQLVHDFAAGNLGVIYLDEIMFSNSVTRPTPNSIDFDSARITINLNDSATLPTQVTLAYDGYKVVDDSKVALTWESSDTAKATVSGNVVSGLAETTEELRLTATLKGTTITKDLTAEVVTPPTPILQYLLTDKTGETVKLPTGWSYYGGYESTITATEEATGGADGTSKYQKLTGTGTSWAAGGWGEQAGDLSDLVSLDFWAKSDAATTIRFGLVSDTEYEHPTTITSTWTKYSISASVFAQKGVDLTKIKTIKYVLPSVDAIIDIDEVVLVRTKAPPASLDISTTSYQYVDPGAVFILPSTGDHVLNPTWETSPASATYAAATGTTLPTQFALDSNTGVITITNAVAAEEATYTITATAGAPDTGTKDSSFKIRVLEIDSDADTFRLYGNDRTDFVGEYFSAYGDTITTEEKSETVSGTTTTFLSLADTNTANWSAGGYQPVAPIDISSYTYFVVKARKVADATDAVSHLVILPKFDADEKAGAAIQPSHYDSDGAKVTGDNPALGTAFSTYKIPISDLKGAQTSNNLTILNVEFPYEEEGSTKYQAEISEMYFE